jgi:hypothetical protein
MIQVEPRLQAAAGHEWEDEARRLEAVAKQRQQVRVGGVGEDRNFLLKISQVQAWLGPLDSNGLL